MLKGMVIKNLVAVWCIAVMCFVQGISASTVPEIPREGFILHGVSFNTGSAVITPASFPILDDIVHRLKVYPEIKVEIQGHTDNTGTASTNLRLSQQRAEAVMNYFIQQGISATRLRAVGYGGTIPIADNLTLEGRTLNRRIELKRFDGIEVICLVHNWSGYTNITAATCLSRARGDRECLTCGHKVFQEEHGEPLEHSFAWTITTPATCLSAGSEMEICSMCLLVRNTSVIFATGHDWNDFGIWDTTKRANCEETGIRTRTRICRNNAEHIDRETETIAELGHFFEIWSIVKQATCEEEGIQTRNCFTCHHKDILPIPQLTGEICNSVSIFDKEKSNNRYGIKFAQNIVSDKAEISVILPNNERAIETNIAIYDMTGNVVWASTASTASTGSTGSATGAAGLSWDLRNSAGRFVANGTYLVIAEVKDRNGRMYQYSAKLGVRR